MKKIFILNFMIILLLFVSSGCEKDATGLEPGQGRLNVYMTDAAALYDSVNITFSHVSAHIDSDWVMVTGDPTMVTRSR